MNARQPEEGPTPDRVRAGRGLLKGKRMIEALEQEHQLERAREDADISRRQEAKLLPPRRRKRRAD